MSDDRRYYRWLIENKDDTFEVLTHTIQHFQGVYPGSYEDLDTAISAGFKRFCEDIVQIPIPKQNTWILRGDIMRNWRLHDNALEEENQHADPWIDRRNDRSDEC